MKPAGPCPKCGFFNCPGGELCPAWEDPNRWDADDTIEDPVTHPAHYMLDGMEVKDVIWAAGYGYGFFAGAAIKYILRAHKKGQQRQDLQKALECVQELLRHAQD